jgi:hypothetical protein
VKANVAPAITAHAFKMKQLKAKKELLAYLKPKIMESSPQFRPQKIKANKSNLKRK